MTTQALPIEWHLEKRKITDLKDFSKNPRKMTKEQAEHIAESLSKFGLVDKPFINIDNTIIGGHQRLRILKKMGHKEIMVHVPDRPLSEEEVTELNVRHNRNTASWDYDILANQFDVDELLKMGFSAEELQVAPVEDLGSQEEPELSEPCKDEDAITKPGDLYELGPHRLVCGDSTDPDVVSRCLNGETPILMVTDPPYGVEYDASWRSGLISQKGKTSVGKVQNDDRVNWSLAWYLFPGSVAYVWHAAWFCSEVQKSLEESNFKIISQIIWNKQQGFSRGDYHWKHEPCWYSVKKGCTHNWQGSRKEFTVWDIDSRACTGDKTNAEESFCHSTQKPLECMARPIRNNSAEGEGVYDPFLGSGTTLIAADGLNRICYGIELSPAYCDIIVDRWVKFRKQKGLPHEVKVNGEIRSEYAHRD